VASGKESQSGSSGDEGEIVEMKHLSDTATLVEQPVLKSSDSRKFSVKRILAPTDFSPKSEKAVNYAIQLAQRLGAKLTLLHVVPEPPAVDYSMEGISIQEIQRWEEKAENFGGRSGTGQASVPRDRRVAGHGASSSGSDRPGRHRLVS
jgi:hypothetical protein